MIVSHTHKFIFLRTEKTASTSMEVALSNILTDNDVIYKSFSGNWKKYLPISPGGLKRMAPYIFGLHTHASASQARMILGKKIFDSYYKFSVERDPWDRQLSLYSHRIHKEEKDKTLNNFDGDMQNWLWRQLYYTRLNNWKIYTIGNRVITDKIIRYDDLEQGLKNVFHEIGINEPFQLPHKRRSPSGERLPYANYYSETSKNLVHRWYEKEINEFGFKFVGTPKIS